MYIIILTGTFKPVESSDICKACKAGYVALETGTLVCEQCQAGSYCPVSELFMNVHDVWRYKTASKNKIMHKVGRHQT